MTEGGKTGPRALPGVVTAIILALVTTAIGYAFGVVSERRKDAIARLDVQIGSLYGPLYAVVQANDISWRRFSERYWSDYLRRRRSYFNDADPPSASQVRVWRLWMTQVFQPLNEKAATIIVEHGDQADPAGLPRSFLAMVAHAGAYRAVLAGWARDSPKMPPLRSAEANVALTPYPRHFATCVAMRYHALLDRRSRLQASLLATADAAALPSSGCNSDD